VSRVLVIRQYEVSPGAPHARLRLIDETGDSDLYMDDWEYDGYPDAERDANAKALDALVKKYGDIRPLGRALADGWVPFQTEEIQVHRHWWTGKTTDGSPEYAYSGRRWWLWRAGDGR
jgi:hypothetical protein